MDASVRRLQLRILSLRFPVRWTDGVRVGESPFPGLTLRRALTGSH